MRETKGARGRRPRISKEDMAKREQAIIDDIRAGEMSYRQIAAKHGVSLPTVNNKARKAGISRGRRGAVRATTGRPGRPRKAAARPVRKAARRGRPRKAASAAGAETTLGRPRRGRPRGSTNRATTGARRGRPRGAARVQAGFNDAFRELVLQHYPGISLLQFEKLTRAVQAAIA
jgi:DNA-binding CsgD family transcriptional regulator